MFNVDDSEVKVQQEIWAEHNFIDGQTDGFLTHINKNKINDIDYITGVLAGLNAWRNELVNRQTNPNFKAVDDCPF